MRKDGTVVAECIHARDVLFTLPTPVDRSFGVSHASVFIGRRFSLIRQCIVVEVGSGIVGASDSDGI